MNSYELRLGAESRWVFGLCVLVAVVSFVAFLSGYLVGVPVPLVYSGYITIIALVAPMALLFFAVPITFAALVRGIDRPLTKCVEHFSRRTGLLDGMIGTLAPLLLTPLLLGAFGTMKQLMPLVVPYVWDDVFAAAGQLIFFGYRPWQVTHALFGTPSATQIINTIYVAWFPLLFFTVVGFAALARPYLRARFFTAFFLAWILLGVVAAYLFASAGPCYAALIGSSADFTPLMQRLHRLDAAGRLLETVTWQNELWRANLEQRYGFGLGISAMPSMHNAIAFLYVLCAARGPMIVRAATWLFAVAILVGSVHLGWHYLVDGLGAWAGMAGVWWLAGRYLEWCQYAQPDTAGERGASGGGDPEGTRFPGPVLA